MRVFYAEEISCLRIKNGRFIINSYHWRTVQRKLEDSKCSTKNFLIFVYLITYEDHPIKRDINFDKSYIYVLKIIPKFVSTKLYFEFCF